jgi:hypothetical protein
MGLSCWGGRGVVWPPLTAQTHFSLFFFFFFFFGLPGWPDHPQRPRGGFRGGLPGWPATPWPKWGGPATPFFGQGVAPTTPISSPPPLFLFLNPKKTKNKKQKKILKCSKLRRFGQAQNAVVLERMVV